MRNYVRISNELFKEFERALRKGQECSFIYLNKNNDKVSIKSKISKFLNIDGSEYMDTNIGERIRLDKIVTFNGDDTRYLNHY